MNAGAHRPDAAELVKPPLSLGMEVASAASLDRSAAPIIPYWRKSASAVPNDIPLPSTTGSRSPDRPRVRVQERLRVVAVQGARSSHADKNLRPIVTFSRIHSAPATAFRKSPSISVPVQFRRAGFRKQQCM
jgi:hypothetical protein